MAGTPETKASEATATLDMDTIRLNLAEEMADKQAKVEASLATLSDRLAESIEAAMKKMVREKFLESLERSNEELLNSTRELLNAHLDSPASRMRQLEAQVIRENPALFRAIDEAARRGFSAEPTSPSSN